MTDNLSDIQPTPAAAIAGRWTTGTKRLQSGVVVRGRTLSLMGELLGGSLPAVVLDWIIFEGVTSEITDQARRTAEIYKARLYVVARILDYPKLVLGRGADIRDVQPNLEAGEVGPTHFSAEEIWEIYSWGVVEVTPSLDTAPFPAADDAAGRAPEPGPAGTTLPQEPKRLPRSAG